MKQIYFQKEFITELIEIGRYVNMKKILLIVSLILILFSLYGCDQGTSSSASGKSNTIKSESDMKLNQNNSQKHQDERDSYGVFDVYEITGDTSFGTLISKNRIDKNYQDDLDKQSTTAGMVKVEEQYLNIWKSELSFSMHNYLKMLTNEDQKQFIELQKKWEESTISNLEFEQDILSNTNKYNFMLGSGIEFLKVSQIREAYRQRTIRIKYLTYLFETQTSNPKPLKNCLSLVFKN